MKWILLQVWAPLRVAPSSSAEMVSALLFGETCNVVNEQEDWVLVACDHDHYKGWIPQNYLTPFTHDYHGWKTLVTGRQARFYSDNDEEIWLSPGSQIPANNMLNIDGVIYWGNDILHSEVFDGDLTQFAYQFLNTPYLWGGRSIFGIDCSGFTQVIYKLAGIKIPRDASQQFQQGEEVLFGQHQTGDLAFFEKDGKITHVGMLLDQDRIIHASVKVRIDQLSTEGIIHSNHGGLTHRLAGIKRLR